MDNSSDVSPDQVLAHVALVGVDGSSAAILCECFRQFSMNTLAIAAQEAGRLAVERFDACVLPLDERADRVLTAIRRSPENAHAVIYGICGSVAEAMPFSGYGINALFMHPLERHAALRVVRTTHLMVLRELRRYVRLPLVSAVTLRTGTESFPASSTEISAGGVCLHTRARLAVTQSVQVRLQLPDAGELSLPAVVCWVRPDEELAGLRFEPGAPHRPQLRRWIDKYLDED